MATLRLNIKAIKKASKERGIENARQLSLATGVNYFDCYNLFVKGEQINMKLNTLALLCSGLKVTPSDLLIYKA
jgi:DNA-binding Xre family transcriptional regulator